MTAGPSAPDERPAGPAHAASTGGATLRRSSRWLATVPRHLGRARTSTVILSLLFLGIGTLYLGVHPTSAQTTTPAGGVVQPAPATATSTTRARTTVPATPSPAPTSTSSAPTRSTAATSTPTTSAPTGTPTTSAPSGSTTPGLPTVASTSAAPTS